MSMNKRQTSILFAAVGLLLILMLSGCGCDPPVWKAMPCRNEPADGEFYIVNDRGFEVEDRCLLNAYVEVGGSGASFTFKGIFGCEPLSGCGFSIQIRQGGRAWELTGTRRGSCIVLQGEEDRAALLKCLAGEGAVDICIQNCESPEESFRFSAEPGNFAELCGVSGNTYGK
jgi:hypothetical protein